MLKSQYGEVTWGKWLELEKARIERDPNRTAVIHTRGNNKALWVNNVVEFDHQSKPYLVEFEDLI